MANTQNMREFVESVGDATARVKLVQLLDVSDLLTVNVSADRKKLEAALTVPGLPEAARQSIQESINTLDTEAIPTIGETMETLQGFCSDSEILGWLAKGIKKYINEYRWQARKKEKENE